MKEHLSESIYLAKSIIHQWERKKGKGTALPPSVGMNQKVRIEPTFEGLKENEKITIPMSPGQSVKLCQYIEQEYQDDLEANENRSVLVMAEKFSFYVDDRGNPKGASLIFYLNPQNPHEHRNRKQRVKASSKY